MSWIEDKRRYRRYTARVAALPQGYATAVTGLERWVMMFGPGGGPTLMPALEDLVELFEQSAADGTPVREVVGEDPAGFAETFLANYDTGAWIEKERARLNEAIDRAAEETARRRPA